MIMNEKKNKPPSTNNKLNRDLSCGLPRPHNVIKNNTSLECIDIQQNMFLDIKKPTNENKLIFKDYLPEEIEFFELFHQNFNRAKMCRFMFQLS
jgi:hypothetical protein